jgi:general secretion pathway protein C
MNYNWRNYLNSNQLIKSTKILFIICVFYALYLFINGFATTWLEYKVRPQVSVTPKQIDKQEQRQIENRQLSDFEIISQRNIFGGLRSPNSQTKQASKAKLNIEKMPVAQSLDVQLLGTIVSASAQKNWAIILHKSKKNQAIYRQGEKLENFTIKKILRNKVVVNNGKRNEILIMENNEQVESRIPKESSETLNTNTTHNVSLDSSVIKNSGSNISSLLKHIRIKPYKDKKGNKGFQLVNLNNENLFTKLGLKNKDILLSFNNKSFKKPNSITKFYQHIQNKKHTNLTIKRENSLKHINYKFF